jgi:hypothetical protein
VVVVGLTDNPFPIPAKVPPQEDVYHLITSPVPPPPPLKESVLLEPIQIVEGDAVADVGSADF